MEIKKDSVIINIDEPLTKLEMSIVEFNADILNKILELKNNQVYNSFIASLETTLNFIHTLERVGEDKWTQRESWRK